MTRTERVNLLVSPQEKADLDLRAKKAGLTTSELVRRAVVAFDPEDDLDELRELADELAGAVERMEKKLDATLAKVADYEAALADKESIRAAAVAEIAETGQVWPFSVPDLELEGRDAP